MQQKGWSSCAAHQATYALAASTTASYDVYVRKLQQFCVRNNFVFPPTVSGVLAEFFCELCDSSNKPRGVLNMASAAIKNFYKVHDLNCDLIFDADIDKLIKGLVKSGTTVPMARSSAMPASCFSSLFLGWPDNSQLSIKQLRLKCLALMSLTLMLRPSDVAPRGKHFHPDSGEESSLIFSTDCLEFLSNGNVLLTIFGSKNDTNRAGFKVTLPPHSVPKLDPVQTLRDYLSATAHLRSPILKPVFLSLVRPFAALTSPQVGAVLNEAIHLAGLSGKGFSAKFFRPTGATLAVEAGIDPEVVRKTGRWKTSHVFYEHYVHSRTPAALTEATIRVPP
jgi:hypothetical protein